MTEHLNRELFLDEPTKEDLFATVISVDDHLVEPPTMFEGRLEARFQHLAPKVIETELGHQVWEFDGATYSQVGMNAVAGRRPETVRLEPFRFEQMRPGCYDIDARISDMDVNGVWASLNFPSQISGFCGRIFSGATDKELGSAVTRAWNDWLFEEWYSPYKDRIIPLGITMLHDPIAAADEIRRNAARGFKAVALPERPQRIGLPSIFLPYWEPIIEALVETDTVACLHVGSTGMADLPEGSPMLALGATLFGQLSLTACAEWLWSGWAAKYPTLKIQMAEGGIGWVAMLLDRLDNIVDRSGYSLDWDLRPAEVLQRNFYFCTLDDPSTIDTRHRIGIDHIMVETDYPHGDGTWPHTQSTLRGVWGHLPSDELRKICSTNAATLFRHPLPTAVYPI